jgi:hypothetical protein
MDLVAQSCLLRSWITRDQVLGNKLQPEAPSEHPSADTQCPAAFTPVSKKDPWHTAEARFRRPGWALGDAADPNSYRQMPFEPLEPLRVRWFGGFYCRANARHGQRARVASYIFKYVLTCVAHKYARVHMMDSLYIHADACQLSLWRQTAPFSISGDVCAYSYRVLEHIIHVGSSHIPGQAGPLALSISVEFGFLAALIAGFPAVPRRGGVAQTGLSITR